MHCEVEWLVRPEEARSLAMFTVGASPAGAMTEKLWDKYVKAEHSVLYPVLLKVTMWQIPNRVMTHLTRHHVGVQFYVRTSRPDRDGEPGDKRDMVMVINPVALVNMARKRLCDLAWCETKEAMEMVKEKMREGDPFLEILAKYMVPDCVYKGRCTEMKPCGRIK